MKRCPSFFTFLQLWFKLSLVLVWVLGSQHAFAQLSPGKLSKAHSQLEGLANCTQCHNIGDKISEQKCLSCHKDLNTRITAKKGFHVSAQVKDKECISCHSEHHGLNFDMVRFDKKTFNHNSTGYEHKGAHKAISMDCAQCHKPDNIASTTLKKDPNTFLGLEPKCISCHEDYHQKTLSTNCASCHNETKFKPATVFSHDKTSFALRGAHKTVNCIECHKVTTKNGQKFQQFGDIPHKNCTSCHNDVHKGQFGTNCKSCHSEESFKRISPSKDFQHQLTGFTLEGAHKRLDCAACHDGRNNVAKNSFQEFDKLVKIECLTCHKDAHEGKFGTDCKQCHSQNSFTITNTKTLSDFDHEKTDFKLIGKHQAVDCRKCHVGELTAPLVHNKCMDCHKDYHDGDFAAKPDIYPDCRSCHKETGFSPSLFTLELHENASFALTGAHIATPCISCHFKDNRWTFKGLSSQCVDCHKDIHQGFIDHQYYGTEGCKSCHNTDAWTSIRFDHQVTDFGLEGKHSTIACASCHIDRTVTPIKQTFKGINKACEQCHDNIHGDQFIRDGITDCKRCHGFEGWDRSHFNHDNTRFKLTGAHLKVDCNKCHQSEIRNGKQVVIYATSKLACTDCHK